MGMGARARDRRRTRTTRTAVGAPPAVDGTGLEEALRQRLSGEVRFTAGDRALYATDGGNYRQPPIGVVIPRTIDDVIQAVATAREYDVPVLPRGGGTSLAGQCCNRALVLDCSKYLNAVVEIDADRRRARVQPGCILDDLRAPAAASGLTFGPDPATHTRCTLGGMIGNNSCGVHSVLAEFHGPGPRTEDSLEALDVLTYDGLRLQVGPTPPDALERIIAAGGRCGEIYGRLRDLRDRYAARIRARFPNIPRRVSGYNLPALLPENGFNVARALCGSEGTCVTILEATLTLIPAKPQRALLVLGYPSVDAAADDVPRLREFRPVGLEGMDDLLVHHLRAKGLHASDLSLLPEGKGWLLVEFGGESEADVRAQAREAADALRQSGNAPSMKLLVSGDEQHRLWTIREAGLGATAFVPGERDTWPGWEDSAVPVDRVGEYLRALRALFDKYGYHPALYGHFGQGCIHCRVDFELTTTAGIEAYRHFTREAAELVTRFGGDISGEHGDGQARSDLLPILFGDELVEAFREFKAIWDPRWKMNPGKVVDPRSRTTDLRLGAGWHPARPRTHFRFPNDDGSFGRATLRCIGVGECRRLHGGTMCPSFMVLREEQHSTRGRAHLLFEMLHGELRHEGWRSEAVKESLDLCLACKGCKSDCPVNVDMATYKAEFLSHYYRGRVRPRHAYAFGLVREWSRLASRAPRMANVLANTPFLSRALRWAAGIAPQRTLPRFAPRTFTGTWRPRRRPASAPTPHDVVMLWPDTFNDHFHPETLTAAADVLAHAGFHVTLPRRRLCCGRPLYDYGMLRRARQRLRQVLRSLRPQIEAGTPIVGLEPSCVSVFRDEMVALFPDDPLARRLRAQVFTLAEFVTAQHDRFHFPTLPRRALLHGHCHHKALMTLRTDTALLDHIGVEYQVPDSGCCGMAGGFGFERDKYALSVAVGERVLLPAIRAADASTLIITDGFSCREQIRQCTGRSALHLAQVLQMALAAAPAERREPPSRAPGHDPARGSA